MATKSLQDLFPALLRRPLRVVTAAELIELGCSREAIRHGEASGRLHRIHQGVYSVGSPHLSRHDAFLAAVVAVGPRGALSHDSAAALWGIRRDRPALPIEVSVPSKVTRLRPRLRVHRRRLDPGEVTRRYGIPVTTPAITLLDLAARLEEPELERTLSQADQLGLIDPERLQRKLVHWTGRTGVRPLRGTLFRHTFRLTRSELERLFIPSAIRAGLAVPDTRQTVTGFEVDFFWPTLGLVVETDGLRYHRTPWQQAKDLRREQAHSAAGLTPLRFTHWQVKYETTTVERVLRDVGKRLTACA